MQNGQSRVTIHMAASLDGFIARRDRRIDWLETADKIVPTQPLRPGEYVLSSRAAFVNLFCLGVANQREVAGNLVSVV